MKDQKDQADAKDQSSPVLNSKRGKSKSKAIEIPSVQLPKGGGAIKAIDEKFAVNAVNGTSSLSVPLPVSQARGVVPDLRLSYNSGGGNGVFGLGWDVGLGTIKRKTNQELPQYVDAADSDTYLLAESEDLVPEFAKESDGSFSMEDGKYVIRKQGSTDGLYNIQFYKPRTEGTFSRIERWTHKTTGVVRWRVTTRENVTTLYGWSAASCIADPADPTGRKIYEWLPEFQFDDKGNSCHYLYKAEDDTGFDETLLHNRHRRKNGDLTYTNRYPEKILYGNTVPYKNFGDAFPLEASYMFRLVFDYGEYDTAAPYQKTQEWTFRPDPFSDYKPGFELRTTRLCQRVLLFHHFAALPGGSALVKSLNFTYDTAAEEGFTFLSSITTYGYIKQTDGSYTDKHFPPMEFTYQKHAWNKQVKTVATEDVVNAPAGIDEPKYHFTDLWGEGLSGILTEQADALYYKRNLGGGQFSRAAAVTPQPNFSDMEHKLQLSDLDGDGAKQLVSLKEDPKGYFELNRDENKDSRGSEWDNTWLPFRSFKQLPNIDFKDRNMRMIDLTGDGKPDLLITEDHVFTWYESEGRDGFAAARRTPKPLDEDNSPAIVFSDRVQSIFLADMSGHGLTDIVRVRGGEVCYWPNLGYGNFGAKVSMDNAPVFDAPDSFNPSFLQLADIDGSGTADLVYFGKRTCRLWLNFSGNSLSSEPIEFTSFPEAHDQSDIAVIDLLGTGTSCLVWSSSLPKDANTPLRYVDLMDSKKPHIMTSYKNNMGKEVLLTYTPSTRFYLDDAKAGRPWVTKLHFPVQCVARTEIIDHVTGHQFVSSYAYHHGYYDQPEREFRGFGMVEQTDAEHFDHWIKSGASNVVEQELHQEPVITKSWFHTGAFLGQDNILTQFASDYWYEEMTRQGFAVTASEHQLDDARVVPAPGLAADYTEHMSGLEWQQALRACKGFGIRTETFAHDAPLTGATADELQTQLTPYSVSSKNCTVELLQPKGQNRYAVFTVKDSETLTYAYERELENARISHDLNIVYDEYGNVLEAAKVVYGRSAPDTALPAATQTAQGRDAISYVQQVYTKDALSTNAYRLRMLAEEKTFELRGVDRTGDYFAVADFADILTGATDVPYQSHSNNPAPGSPEKRLIEHVRTLYYRNNLSGPLNLYDLEPRGLQYEQYQLAYTPSLATDIFGAKATDALFTEGKFTHQDDTNWWVPSGIIRYKTPAEPLLAAENRFFMPTSYTDPYGAPTTVTYVSGSAFTFVGGTEDAVGNTTTVTIFDFRLLSPQRIRDENDNITEVLVDELGLLKASAVFGKGSEADDLTGLNAHTDAGEAALAASFFAAGTSTQLVAHGKTLLQHATVRMVYDLTAYQTSGKPVASASIMREEHFADNPDSPLQLSFEYSGGTGQVVMKKTQAEPGVAKQLILQPDDSYTVTEIDTAASNPQQLRWVGDGRTVLNNKGNPVKQYEPYFSVTHKYEDNKELVESGVTSVTYYDALNRVVRTNLPAGTFTKSVYTPWSQVDYDPSDNVLDPDCSWYWDRVNSLMDAELTAEGKDPAREKQAALASAKHAGTPKTQHFDALKRPVLQVEHNKNITTDADEFYNTLAALDVEGNLRSVTDARGNVVMRHKYDMLGNLVYQNGTDNGERWMLLNCGDDPLRTWDGRSHEFQYSYDALQRPTQTKVIGGDGPAPLNNIHERTFYGETEPNAKQKNLCGQPVRRYDTGGLVETPEYDFKEQPVISHRRLFRKYKEVANWTDANLTADLEVETHTVTSSFNALGRVTSQTLPDASVVTTIYNQAGLLGGKTATTPDGTTSPLITDVDYNEKGQRTKIAYGNGVTTTFIYDKQTFRLLRLTSKRQNGETLQDLYYTFDAMGNVTHLEDKNIPVTFFGNAMTSGLSGYTYDALYRLVQATGRENNAALAFGSQDNWNDADFMKLASVGDPLAVRNYTENYQYDQVGNILQMQHQASGNNWTRDYTYAAANNRLASTKVGVTTYTYSHHATAGFITAMPHLEEMGWNFKEELVKTIRQKTNDGSTPETTYYQYDSQGQRLRKITENAAPAGEEPTQKEERRYIGDYERYQKHSGTNAGLTRHTVRAMDDNHCFAMIEWRDAGDGAVDDGTEARLIRYQLQSHIGSINLELDDTAQVITYEEYHPYGTTAYQLKNAAISAAAKRYRFTGMERDEESGLSYHSARYYAPWLGRWLSADPLGIAEGVNFYLYALANPYFYSDPSGLDPDPTQFSDFQSYWDAYDYSISEEDARGRWDESQTMERDDIATEEYEEYEETYEEEYEETYTTQEDTGIRYAAVGAVGFMSGDALIPEPTDLAWPKWAGYAVVGALAAGTLYLTATTTVTRTRIRTRTRTRTRRRRLPLTYITYTLSNPVTGQIYVGRSMGYGTPQQIMMARFAGHHMRAAGFGNPTLDRALPATTTFARRHSDPSYRAIRGREQNVIDAFRALPRTAAGLSRSGNAINGIGLTNFRRPLYMAASLMMFGPVSTSLIFAQHPLAAAVP